MLSKKGSKKVEGAAMASYTSGPGIGTRKEENVRIYPRKSVGGVNTLLIRSAPSLRIPVHSEDRISRLAVPK